MQFKKTIGLTAALAAGVSLTMASNHREAPITALDRAADITDVFAFVSYGPNQQPGTTPDKLTMIMCVDPLLDPANGPTLFPFDPGIRYQIGIDNDHDARPDYAIRARFSTEFQLPDVYTSVAGFGDNGAFNPRTGALVVPPRIDEFSDVGLNQRQTYTLEVVNLKNGKSTQLVNDDGSPFYAVPGNAGARTMDYAALYKEGTYALSNGVSVFAGTVDDPFFIDLGATFDTANFRTLASGVPGVLTDAEDGAQQNFASDTISGFAVNAIAVEIPIQLLTASGQLEPADSPFATLGIVANTLRPRVSVRRSPNPSVASADFRQVQRLGNPLINELVIGIGSKDRFSMEVPKNDLQFSNFFLDPPIVGIVEALYGGALAVPSAPRVDLTPLIAYAAPIAAPGTPAGPFADLLRINTGVPATPVASANRLGLIGGDAAGYPNGRRLMDDVVDITLRVAVGGVLDPTFAGYAPGVNDRLGDGVNVNDAAFGDSFPYLGLCPDGRNRRHVDPGEIGGGPVN